MSSQLQEPHRKLKKSSAVSLRDERADTPISLVRSGKNHDPNCVS